MHIFCILNTINKQTNIKIQCRGKGGLTQIFNFPDFQHAWAKFEFLYSYSECRQITTRYISKFHHSPYWSAAQADGLPWQTHWQPERPVGGRVLPCNDQARPPHPSPPVLIKVILTVMHKSRQLRAGWLAGNATDPPRVEELGIKQGKIPPLNKVKRKSMFPPPVDSESCLRMLPLLCFFIIPLFKRDFFCLNFNCFKSAPGL